MKIYRGSLIGIIFTLLSGIATSHDLGGDPSKYPPYFIVNHGLLDSVVVTVHGWLDNKTPCETMATLMNSQMEIEENYHSYSCVNETQAREVVKATIK